ncbi:DUF2971 domain-containing protein [Brachyspira hyodysenteriae]|uniref:DUF2971 domain-containing protein n=1 Tax=Brachyspira hyodysenteriae TaxID=159 RepID=UPI00069A85DE|nr:DUF2971 domain-containing protein [Brachyspira hyodysenteriae]
MEINESLLQILNLIEEKLKKEEFQEALTICTEQIKINKPMLALFFYRGKCYYYLGLKKNHSEYFQLAIKDFDYSLHLLNNTESNYTVKHNEICFYRGLTNIQLKNYINSIKDFTNIINIDNYNISAYFYRGLSYYNLGLANNNESSKTHFELALNDFNKILEMDFENGFDYCNTYYNRGLVNGSLNNLEESIIDFNKAIEYAENINYEKIYYNRAVSYFRLTLNRKKNYIIYYNEFIKDINKVIILTNEKYKHYHDKFVFHFYLALHKDDNFNFFYNNFLEDFNSALKCEKSNECELYSNKGIFYYHLGLKYKNDEYFKLAIENFNNILNLINKNANQYLYNNIHNYARSYYYIGLSYFQLKNYQKVINITNNLKKYKLIYEDMLEINNAQIDSLLTINNKKLESKKFQNQILSLYKETIKLYDNVKYDNTHSLKTFNIILSITDKLNSLKIDNFKKIDFIRNFEYITNLILQTHFNMKYHYEIENNSLYNYTRVNKNILRSILNNTLWCSNTKEFNDPVDPYIRNDKNESSNQFYNYLLERIKVACLTTHNDNTLMWSHYADKHKGICIEYDISQLQNNNNNFILKKIDYNSSMLLFDLKNEILLDNDKSVKSIIDLFTVKSKEWEYEDEYRILFYDEENKNPNGTLINLPIKSICFGVQTSKEDKELVYNIVKSINEKRLNYNNDIIKLYQAELDDNELFKINIKPYKHEKIK